LDSFFFVFGCLDLYLVHSNLWLVVQFFSLRDEGYNFTLGSK
jgi:hypothetical protein